MRIFWGLEYGGTAMEAIANGISLTALSFPGYFVLFQLMDVAWAFVIEPNMGRCQTLEMTGLSSAVQSEVV